MKDSDFTKLLTRCARSAAKHKKLMAQVSEECLKRYGTTYSDADADGIIDSLDHIGGDSFTSKEFDQDMAASGYSRIDI